MLIMQVCYVKKYHHHRCFQLCWAYLFGSLDGLFKLSNFIIVLWYIFRLQFHIYVLKTKVTLLFNFLTSTCLTNIYIIDISISCIPATCKLDDMPSKWKEIWVVSSVISWLSLFKKKSYFLFWMSHCFNKYHCDEHTTILSFNFNVLLPVSSFLT